MADKKVERSGRERPLTPTQKMNAALSDPGTLNVADSAHDKGKSALADKFREREERWRKEQSLRDHQQQVEQQVEQRHDTDAGEAADAGDSRERDGGGAS